MQGATDGDGELRRESSLREDGTQGQRSDLWQQTLQVGSEMCQVVRFAFVAGRPLMTERRPFACLIHVPYLAGLGEYTIYWAVFTSGRYFAHVFWWPLPVCQSDKFTVFLSFVAVE
jgi:hypothetical protein